MRKSVSMPIHKVDSADHPIGIKMMRLNRPEIFSPISIPSECKDLPANLNDMLTKDISTIPKLEAINISQLLTFHPDLFQIYLGETFSLLIVAHNESLFNAEDININIYVQSATSKFGLPPLPILKELEPEESFENIIQYEVKELGSHILICEVTYVINDVRSMFRRFLKFEVLKPFNLITKFYNETEDVLLETQIQNISNDPIFLEKVSLEPVEIYKVESLNHLDSQNSSFVKPYLLPDDIYQYLFRLRANTKHCAIRDTCIGKLDIIWCSKFGEKGKVQSVKLNRTESIVNEVNVTLKNVPNFTTLSEPFDFVCCLLNTRSEKKEYDIYLEENDAIAWGCICVQKLVLVPMVTKEIKLSAVPLKSGLQYIPNIILKDPINRRSEKFSELSQVFILAQ